MAKTTKTICTRKKGHLGSLPVGTFWSDFCCWFYGFSVSDFICNWLAPWFAFNIDSETLPSPLIFFFFTDISQYIEKSTYWDKANFSSSSTVHGVCRGMKQPLLCPKPCHVLETISPWSITEKPFSFKPLQWRHLWMLLEIMTFQKGCQGLQHLMALLTENSNREYVSKRKYTCQLLTERKRLYSEESFHG